MVKLHGQCNAPGEVIGATRKMQRRMRRKVRCRVKMEERGILGKVRCSQESPEVV